MKPHDTLIETVEKKANESLRARALSAAERCVSDSTYAADMWGRVFGQIDASGETSLIMPDGTIAVLQVVFRGPVSAVSQWERGGNK